MLRKLYACFAGVLLATSLCGAAPARTRYDRAFYTPSEEVVTPHIRWARPYVQGPIRALFLIHRQNQREVIELAQRLQMDYTVFCCETPNIFGETGVGVDRSWRLVQGNSAEEMAEQLHGYLKDDYDVIVVGNIKWDEFPIDCRYHILRKVKSGTGLVGYMPRGHDQYLNRILEKTEFHWGYGNWTGGAQGIDDYFGIGDFVGSVDTQDKHSGQCSVKIVGREVKRGSKEAPRGGYTMHPVEVEPHTEYRFSVWHKAADGGRASVSLHPMPAGVPMPASETWRQAEVTWDTGDRTEFGIYLLNYAVGSVWYDDVSLTKVGEDKNLLPNPGFEHPGPAPGFLAQAYPFASLPAFSKHADRDAFSRGTFQVTRFGEGRIALMRGFSVPLTQIMTPAPQGPMRTAQLDYDYYLAAGIKAILWAARKEPDLTIRSAQPAVTINRADLAKTPILFELATEKPDAEYGYVFAVRDRANRVLPAGAGRVKLAQGKAQLSPYCPALPAGSYFVDLRVLPADQVIFAGGVFLSGNPTVVNFGSVGLEVTSDSLISKLELAKPAFSKDEPITGVLTVDNPPAGAVVSLRVYDNLGRLIGQAQAPAVLDQADFRIETLPACAIMGRLEARLMLGDETLDLKEAAYSLRDFYPDPEDVRHVMWTSPANDFISPYTLREFRKHGVDTQYTNFNEMIPQANLWHIPYATRFTDKKTDWYLEKRLRETGDFVRDPCLTDPAYLAQVADTLTKRARQVTPYSALDFSLGDECHFVSGNWDLCMSPTCNADFREFLKQEYGDLAKLNQSWGTAYESWDEVVPIALKEAKETGHLPQWVDHRRHMETVWASIYHYSRDVIRKVAPEARVGYEGSDTRAGSFHAIDYWKLAQAMDLNNIYYRDFLCSAVRDLGLPNTLFGAGWYGGYAGCRNEPYMRWFPWRALFKGANSLWIWMGFGTAGSVMGYDLSLYPFYKVNCEEVNEIKSGPGKLLVTAERQHDGIALLWSASSVHAAQLTEGFPSMDDTLNCLVRIIHDIGLECKVVSYRQLAEGEVTSDEFKVLLLPCCQALSPAEVEAVKAFAGKGGTVIADLRPAVCDEHCKPYPEGPLDDLFGVKQDTQKFAPTTGDVPLGRAAAVINSVTADAGLTVTTGRAAATIGDAPVIITHKLQSGAAALLNFSLSRYIQAEEAQAEKGEFAGWPAGAATRDSVAEMLQSAGVRPAVTITPELPQVEITRSRPDNPVGLELEYVGILQALPRNPKDYTNLLATLPPAKPATITFAREAHVYDVRLGEYLGKTREVKTKVRPGVAKLYALLPYKVEGLACSATDSVGQGKQVEYTVRLDTGASKPGTHCVHVEVLDATGKTRACYGANLLANEGQAAGAFTPAFNDPTGTWTIRARDVATGAQGAAAVEVNAR